MLHLQWKSVCISTQQLGGSGGMPPKILKLDALGLLLMLFQDQKWHQTIQPCDYTEAAHSLGSYKTQQ